MNIGHHHYTDEYWSAVPSGNGLQELWRSALPTRPFRRPKPLRSGLLNLRLWVYHLESVQRVAAVGVRDGQNIDQREGEVAQSEPVVGVPEYDGQEQVHARTCQADGNFRPSGSSRTLNVHSHTAEADFFDGNAVKASGQNVAEFVQHHTK